MNGNETKTIDRKLLLRELDREVLGGGTDRELLRGFLENCEGSGIFPWKYRRQL